MYSGKWKKLFLTLSLIILACCAVCEAGADKYTQDELAYMPATKQLELFRSGDISPVDVLEAQIARIEKYNGPVNEKREVLKDYLNYNGKVNAISFTNFAEARKKAKEAEERYKNGTARPLEGITVGVKDENEVKGWVITQGSLLFKDKPPCAENAAIIDKLEEAGAIFSVQTTVPEFYLVYTTWSKLFGVTRNPWNLYYTVGGSSGGSGAALSAGFVTLATGSDMGGSIRLPSAFNGIYGFKPPFGRVATSNIQYESYGPMARTFKDMLLMQNVMTGPSPKMHSALYPKLEYPLEYPDIKGVKIAALYMNDWAAAGNDKNTVQAMDKTIAQLRSLGAQVDVFSAKDISMKEFGGPYVEGLMSSEMYVLFDALKGKDTSLLTPYVQRYLKAVGSANLGPTKLMEADKHRGLGHKRCQDVIFTKGYTAIIMPTLATPFVSALVHSDPAYTPVTNGKISKYGDNAMTPIWNLLDRYPVVDVPVLLTEKKVPVGLQVVGNTYHDLDVMRVVAAIDEANESEHLYTGDRFPDFRNEK